MRKAITLFTSIFVVFLLAWHAHAESVTTVLFEADGNTPTGCYCKGESMGNTAFYKCSGRFQDPASMGNNRDQLRTLADNTGDRKCTKLHGTGHLRPAVASHWANRVFASYCTAPNKDGLPSGSIGGDCPRT